MMTDIARKAEVQRVRLLDALLNTEELIRKYHHQADFHHAIYLMVGALPQHVEAMAKSADEAEMLRDTQAGWNI